MPRPEVECAPMQAARGAPTVHISNIKPKRKRTLRATQHMGMWAPRGAIDAHHCASPLLHGSGGQRRHAKSRSRATSAAMSSAEGEGAMSSIAPFASQAGLIIDAAVTRPNRTANGGSNSRPPVGTFSGLCWGSSSTGRLDGSSPLLEVVGLNGRAALFSSPGVTLPLADDDAHEGRSPWRSMPTLARLRHQGPSSPTSPCLQRELRLHPPDSLRRRAKTSSCSSSATISSAVGEDAMPSFTTPDSKAARSKADAVSPRPNKAANGDSDRHTPALSCSERSCGFSRSDELGPRA
mmetsp:Transcript_61068/g.176943  ORF Transcript_61068/g.176943 Transcript_61068/m.176943 type:complete len:294 (+) Transcript_61068:296-1177(+)